MQFAQRIESGGGRSDDLQGLPKPSDPRSGAALGRDNDLAVNDRRTGSDVPGVVSKQRRLVQSLPRREKILTASWAT